MTQLAFATVYLVDDENEPLLDLHLEQIRKNTPVSYRIHAGVNRLQPRLRDRLAARDDVVICECTPTDDRSALENSHYTTQLVQQALDDGATHIAIMHMDAFPIRPDWFPILQTTTEGGDVLAAVCATEDLRGDEPMSCFIFVPRGFHERWGPVGSAADLPLGSPAYRLYKKRNTPETGDPYGLILHTHQLPWHRMLRSNAAEDHPVLAGIYDDLVFHLNAGTRQDKRVTRDFTLFLNSPIPRLRRMLRHFVPRRMRRLLVRPWRLDDAAARIGAVAQGAHEDVRRRLLEDPERYLAYLRGVQHGASAEG